MPHPPCSPAEADDPEGLAGQVGAEEPERLPGLPFAGVDRPFGRDEVPGRREEQGDRDVRRRFREHARRVADLDPAAAGLGDVDVVVADRVVADDLEPRPGRVHHGRVDGVREERQEPFAAGDPPQQLVSRRR
jgi:hypothetical protein